MSNSKNFFDLIEKDRHLGYEATLNGCKRYALVMDDLLNISRWWHIVYYSLSDEKIKEIKFKCNMSFPLFFEDFLKQTNGLYLFSGALCIYGFQEQIDRTGQKAFPYPIDVLNTYERPRDAKESHLFIGGYNWDGSKLYIDVANSKVYRCEKKSATPLNEWPDFWTMLFSEFSRIRSLYTYDGEKIEPESPTTPP